MEHQFVYTLFGLSVSLKAILDQPDINTKLEETSQLTKLLVFSCCFDYT